MQSKNMTQTTFSVEKLDLKPQIFVKAMFFHRIPQIQTPNWNADFCVWLYSLGREILAAIVASDAVI